MPEFSEVFQAVHRRPDEIAERQIDLVEEGQALGVFDPALHPVIAAKSLWAGSHGLAQLLIHVPKFHQLVPDETPMSATDFIEFHASLQIRSLLKPAVASENGDLSGQAS